MEILYQDANSYKLTITPTQARIKAPVPYDTEIYVHFLGLCCMFIDLYEKERLTNTVRGYYFAKIDRMTMYLGTKNKKIWYTYKHAVLTEGGEE